MKWTPQEIGLIILVSSIPFLFALIIIGVLVSGNSASKEGIEFVEKYALTVVALYAGVKIGQKDRI